MATYADLLRSGYNLETGMPNMNDPSQQPNQAPLGHQWTWGDDGEGGGSWAFGNKDAQQLQMLNLGRDYANADTGKKFDMPLYAMNSSTNRPDRVFQAMDPLDEQRVAWQGFQGDPNMPQGAQPGLAGGYSFPGKQTWDEKAVIAGLAAMTGGMAGPALGAAMGVSSGMAGGAVAGATGAGMNSNWDPSAMAQGGAMGGVGGYVGGQFAGGTGTGADVGTYGTSGIESAPAPGLTNFQNAGVGGTAASTTGAAMDFGDIGSWLGSLDGGNPEAMGGYGGVYDNPGGTPGANWGGGGDQNVLDMFGSTDGSQGWSNSPGAWSGGGSGLPADWMTQVAKIFGPTALNGLIQGGLGNRAQHQTSDLLGQTNSLNQPQRQPYQQMSQDLLSNPQNYMQNNPFAKSMTDLYKNNVIPANVAKSGNTGFEADRLGSQFATSVAGNYNTLAQVLAGYGGFNQGASNVGAITPLAMQGNQNYSEMFRGAGDAASKIFGTPTTPQQPQTNPVTGSTVMPQ